MKLKRHSSNPILFPIGESGWESKAVFNPGAIFREGKVHLLYRAVGEHEKYISRLGYATSINGVDFKRMSSRPVFEPEADFDRGAVEDPRIVDLEGNVYVTYVGLSNPPMLGGFIPRTSLAVTTDFSNYDRRGVITPENLDDKDVVLFPEKIRGKYAVLDRPQERVGSKYVGWKTHGLPSIWLAYSDDLCSLQDNQMLMEPVEAWESLKIGAGPPPIRTSKGWLLIYHGVGKLEKPDPLAIGINGKLRELVYSAGAALLDLEDPSKVIARSKTPILSPEEDYECYGDVPYVVFPSGAVVMDEELFVYYGAADKTIGLATCKLDDLVDWLLIENPL